MRLIVTNDDGVFSPGLRALAEAAGKLGEVRVVAPDVEQSSASHAITSARPLYRRRAPLEGLDAYRVNGTPADCVVLGVAQWERVDAVLSGVNLGPNLGNAMWHSGTLAAAKQAALLGVRGIALSTPAGDDGPDFGALRSWIEDVLDLLLRREPALRLVNVNFPPEPRGVRWTCQAVRHYDGHVVRGADPMGREHFWYTVRPIEQLDEGTDLWAVRHGFVSLTPLRLDLTDHAALKDARTRHPEIERADTGSAKLNPA